MDLNQKKLKQLIKEQSSLITDEELFLSSAYQKHLSSMAKAATGRYRNGLQVLMEWNQEESSGLAYTDNYKIHINAANPVTQSLPSRILRSESLVGLAGHETGHLLYTDFTALSMYLTSIRKGVFYPSIPSSFQEIYQNNLEKILELIKEQDTSACITLEKCAAAISNILEDIYIESRVCQFFPGTFRLGIELNNLRMLEQIPSIQYQIDQGYEEFSILCNLILQYCRSGNVNNVTGYSGEYLDYLEDCIPFIEDSLYSDDIKERFTASNHILVILWQYIQPLIEKTQEQLNQLDAANVEKELMELLEKQLYGTPLPTAKGNTLPKQAPVGKKEQRTSPVTPKSSKERQASAAQTLETIKEESNRIELAKTNTILDGNNPGITYNFQYTGSAYEKSASDTFRILNELALQKANQKYEEELSEELQKSVNDIHYGNAHTGIHATVNRLSYVSDTLIKEYYRIAEPVLKLSRRLQKAIAPILKEKSEGGKMKNLQFGKRLDMRALHHQDCSYFVRNKLPSEEPKLAVSILIDCSGSMASADRITYARLTAIALYDFCTSLSIPVSIYGHSTDYYEVELYSYAEFDSIDNQDRYRMMDICARGSNRDGMALRFMAENLCKRPEETKLLILISDGQPNHYGYDGTEAEADLRGIKKEYEKKGITLFAAAIGTDKDKIKRIYKEGFLDITDLKKLPKNMAQLVEQYLK